MCTYRFKFEPGVSLTEAEQTLHLSLIAAAGLHGEAVVRLQAAYTVSEQERVVTVDGSTEVGATIAKIYAGLLLREFGADLFQVRPTSATKPEAIAVPA